MKILSGKLKGRNFFMPHGISPTSNVLRKAIFDIIGHDLEGMEVLELFAGSGAIGLEAFSLGAPSVVFVEKDPRCAKVIEENLRILGIPFSLGKGGGGQIIPADAFTTIRQLDRQGRKFSCVILDPPYEAELGKKALKELKVHDILHPVSWLIVEHNSRDILPEAFGRFVCVRQRQYGRSLLSIFEGKPQLQPL